MFDGIFLINRKELRWILFVFIYYGGRVRRSKMCSFFDKRIFVENVGKKVW